jgi:hypothetical protein
VYGSYVQRSFNVAVAISTDSDNTHLFRGLTRAVAA